MPRFRRIVVCFLSSSVPPPAPKRIQRFCCLLLNAWLESPEFSDGVFL
jgi:hypothetical protein